MEIPPNIEGGGLNDRGNFDRCNWRRFYEKEKRKNGANLTDKERKRKDKRKLYGFFMCERGKYGQKGVQENTSRGGCQFPKWKRW